MNDHGEDFAARVFRYLDGELSKDEAEAFEREVQGDPALDREFRSIAELDLLETLSRSAEPGAGGARPNGGGKLFFMLSWGLGIAAAVVLIVVRGLGTPTPPAAARVALLGAEASQDDFNELLGLDARWLPAGNGSLGDEHGALPSVEEYVARVEQLEESRRAAAFARAEEPLEATRFTVALRPARDLFAAVVTLPDSGPPHLVMAPVALEGGREHVLPRPSVSRSATSAQGVDYDPGFVLPLGVDELVVLVATRADLSAGSSEELERIVAEARARPQTSLEQRRVALRERLEHAGWRVVERRVHD